MAQAQPRLMLINTTKPEEVEAYCRKFAAEPNIVGAATQGPAKGFVGAKRTVCAVSNVTNSPVTLKVKSHDWEGTLDLKSMPEVIQSGQSAVFFHHQNTSRADAAAIVSRGKSYDGTQDVDFLLAWENPAQGEKKVYAEVASAGKSEDPDWDEIRKKLSDSEAKLTVLDEDLGCGVRVRITQNYPVIFSAVLYQVDD